MMIERFFGQPQELVGEGILKKLKPGELILYTYLMWKSERCCSRVVKAKDSEITAAVGVASRTLCNARKKLQELGLMLYQAGPGNIYIYTVCDAKTRQPYPGDPTTKIEYQKRASKRSEDVKPASPLGTTPTRKAPKSADERPETYGVPLDFSK